MKYALAAALGSSLIAGVYFYGYYSGKNQGRIEQLEDIVEAERKRREIDGRVQNLDDYELCLRIGGLPEQCEQLRGVAATPAD